MHCNGIQYIFNLTGDNGGNMTSCLVSSKTGKKLKVKEILGTMTKEKEIKIVKFVLFSFL